MKDKNITLVLVVIVIVVMAVVWQWKQSYEREQQVKRDAAITKCEKNGGTFLRKDKAIGICEYPPGTTACADGTHSVKVSKLISLCVKE